MKIKRVQIKNGYKRFQHLKIELGDRPARIVALLGPNGCGKAACSTPFCSNKPINTSKSATARATTPITQ